MLTSENNLTPKEPILGYLSSSETITVEGMTIRSPAPVITACWKLVQKGYDPERPLHAYRGDMLCLIATSIGAVDAGVAERVKALNALKARKKAEAAYGDV